MKVVEICGHPCSGICCDPCKCDTCSRANKSGMRAVMKPASNQDIPLEKHNRTPSSGTSGSGANDWKKYASGGVIEDDMAFFQRAQALRSPFQENSPQPFSGNSVSNTVQGIGTADSAKLVESPSTPTRGGTRLLKVSPVKNTEPKTPKPSDPNLLIDISPSPSQRYRFQEQYMMEPLQPSHPTDLFKASMQPGQSLLD